MQPGATTTQRMDKHTEILHAFDNLDRAINRLARVVDRIQSGERAEKLPGQPELSVDPVKDTITLAEFLENSSEIINRQVERINSLANELGHLLF